MKQPKEVISIDKETIAAMPVTEYPGAITVVETVDSAVAAVEVLARETAVGFGRQGRGAAQDDASRLARGGHCPGADGLCIRKSGL